VSHSKFISEFSCTHHGMQLSCKMKDPLCGQLFPKDDNMQNSVRKSVHTILKDWFAASIRKLPERRHSALTSVGSMWSVLKSDYAAVIISQPVFQVSPNHF
jgi:hypothetical protein